MSDKLAINTLRINGVAAVNKANSGHPGIVIGAAPMIHTIFSRHLNFDPKNPKWVNRDRFILSAGHGSALLYSQLRILGLISTHDLENFRQLNSITPGHPEYGMTAGVESTTGPLGQGIAMAVGIAVAEEHLRSKFKEIDHYTYVICGDGDLEEGISTEAMSFAGHQKLSKLIVLHDSNDVQLDTHVKETFSENLRKKIESLAWDYQLVKTNSIEEIDKAIIRAKKSNKPSFIEVKTIIGEGATLQGTSAVHGMPLGKDFEVVKKYYSWKFGDFEIPKAVETLYKKTLFTRGAKAFKAFKASKNLNTFLTNEEINFDISLTKNTATRVSSGEVIQHLNKNVQNWIGGSADLSSSTKVAGGDGVFSPKNRKGRNILFGVREFAMAAIGNGIALHSNFKVFTSTFLVFSDYLKPAARLSAMMKLPVTYIFTHDSVYVGEDGGTHQPIEQLAMLRSIPNFTVLRPSDEKEVLGSYKIALNSKTTPTALVLTRQNIHSINETNEGKFVKGIYQVVANKSKWTLVASGSELHNIVEIAKKHKLNAYSISNWKGKVTWDTQKAISVEAATTFGLSKFAQFNIGIDSFGESGNGDKVYEHFKLDIKNLEKTILKIIKDN